MNESALKYRSDIDGLRAVAVMSVLVYHLNPGLLPGGFLGVDVFFVISGFVITQSISSVMGEGTAAWIARFYARRMWRLLPNLLLCLLVTGCAVWLFVPEPSENLLAGVFATAGLSNVHFWLTEKDYFSQALELNAFMHTWSLGVEEQFYLVFPWLFFTASWAPSPARTALLRAFFGAIALASLVAFIYSEAHLPSETRFLMPLRLWELAAGAFTFVLSSGLAARHRSVPASGHGVWATAAAILMAAAFLASADDRGVTTVAAVLATAVLLLLPHDSPRIRNLLGSAPATYVGKRSYSLYLWHWPVVSLSHWTVGVTALTLPVQLILIVSLSLFFYRFVETPLRQRHRVTSVPGTYGIFLVSCSLVAASLYALASTNSIMGIRSARQVASEAASIPAFHPLPGSNLPYNPTCVVDGKTKLLTPRTVDLCTIPPASAGAPRLWALGDSHAGHLQGLLHELHRAAGVGVHLVETPGIPFPMLAGEVFPPREDIWQQIRSRVQPGDIILVSRLFLDRKTRQPVDTLAAWLTALEQLAAEAELMGSRLVVVGPPPAFRFKSSASCFQFLGSMSNCDMDRAALLMSIGPIYDALNEAARRSAGKLVIFDTFNALCPPRNAVCSPFSNGKLFMRDADHVNVLAGQMLEPAFSRFLQSEGLLKTAPGAQGAGAHPIRDIIFSDSEYPGFVASVEGVSGPEPWGRWSDALVGRSVLMNFATPLPEGTRMRLTVRPFVPNENKPLLIRIGGAETQHILVPGNNVIELRVQASPEGASTLELVPHLSATPESLGINGDTRQLGIGLISLEFIRP